MTTEFKELRVKRKFIWKVKNFPNERENLTGRSYDSDEVEIKVDGHPTSWKFECFPNGRVLLFDQFVAFAAVNTNFRTNNTFKGYEGTIKLGIVSSSGEIVNERSVNAGLRRLECFQKNFMIDGFIGREALMLDAANLLPNNVLTLSIEFSLFKYKTVADPKKPTNKHQLRLLMPNFKLLYDEKLFADLSITSSDGVTFRGHKVVLAARSPVFCEMLKFGEVANGCVVIKDVSSGVLKQLLKFIYTGEVENMEAIVWDLIVAADKLLIQRLKYFCSNHIRDTLSSETIFKALSLIDRIPKLSGLFKHCVDFIDKNHQTLMATDGWTRKSPEITRMILVEVLRRQNHYREHEVQYI